MIDVGSRFGDYQVHEYLGGGGLGDVYRVFDLKLRRQVALKVLREDLMGDSSATRRLLREAGAASSLEHPNVASVYGVEEIEGRLAIVMEYVDGTSLDRVLRDGPLAPDEVVKIGLQACSALAAAHAEGLVHRDIKPANLLRDSDGRIRLADFGLVTHAASKGENRATVKIPRIRIRTTESLSTTRSGVVVGTVAYMSPEQVRGEEVDARSDLFSLGVVLYEAVTGRNPFEGASHADTAAAVLHAQPEPAGKIRDGVPPGLDALILYCLRKNPATRPESALKLWEALQELARTGSRRGVKRALGKDRSLPAAIGTGLLPVLLGAALLTQISWDGLLLDSEVPVRGEEARRLYQRSEVVDKRGTMLEALEIRIGLLRRAVEQEPGNPFLQAKLAWTLADLYTEAAETDPREEIETLARSALAVNPDLASAWSAIARLHVAHGEPVAALEPAMRAIRADPTDPAGYFLAAQSYAARERNERGLALVRDGLERSRDEVRARVYLASFLMTAGDLDSAAAEYRKILEARPDNPDALNNLAVISYWQGDVTEAARLFRKQAELWPGDPSAASNLGTAYYFLGRMNDALSQYDRAIELDPENPLHYRNRADALVELGRTSEAGQSWEKSADLCARRLGAGAADPEFVSECAVDAAKAGRMDQAREWIEKAKRLAPGDVAVLGNAVVVFALAGNRAETLTHARRALDTGYPAESLRNAPELQAWLADPEFRAILFERP